jgi:hypothetical protein
MGAEQFTTLAEGADPAAAFAEAVRRAEFEHGHGGYTGTIAEKGSFTVIDAAPRTREDALDLARRLLAGADPRVDDKWGPAGAVPLAADSSTAAGPEGWLFFGWASS